MERRLSKAAGARRLSIYVVGGVSLFLLLHVLLNSATYLVTAHPSGRAMRAILNRPIARRSQKLRILHLIDLPTHMSIMDRWFARSQVACSSHGELVEDAPIWGPGFAEYHSNESLSDNIRLRYGASNYFDAILPYYNTDQVAVHQQQNDSASLSRQLKELSQLGVVIVDRPHEMRDFRRRLFMSEANVTLTLCPYPNECMDYRPLFESQTLLVHQPHPVSHNLFYYPIANEDGPIARPNDVLLAGSLAPEMYPLRNRLWHLQAKQTINVTVRHHPGYPDLMSEAEKNASQVFGSPLLQLSFDCVLSQINLGWLEQQLRDFSTALGSHKICLVTASRWGYSIQKYGEAALAGCLIMGSIPLDRHSAFKSFVVPLSMSDTDATIAETIDYWLSHEEERLQKTQLAQEYFQRHFLHQNYVYDLVKWIRLAQQGQRGLILPYDWHPLPDPLPLDG